MPTLAEAWPKKPPEESEQDIESPPNRTDRHHEEPASRESARRELAELGMDIASLMTQLAVKSATDFATYDEFVDWRRRAVLAKNHREQRRMFLKEWLRRNPGQPTQRKRKSAAQPKEPNPQAIQDTLTARRKIAADMALSDISMGMFLRVASKRVGQIEAVYNAVVRFIDEDTEDSWVELLAIVDRVRPNLDEPVIGDDSNETVDE